MNDNHGRLAFQGALLCGVLLACKSHRTQISGAIVVDGAAFEATECRSMQTLAASGGGMRRWVTFIDATGRQVQFNDRDSVSVQYTPSEGATPIDVGSGCGSMNVTSGEEQGPVAMSGAIKLDCRGSGHAVRADVSFAHCGPFGRGP